MSDLFDGLDVTPAPRAGQVPADELHLGLLAFASEPRCRQSTPSAPCRPWPPIDLRGPKGDPIGEKQTPFQKRIPSFRDCSASLSRE
jgi:hypothetical protein